MKILPTPTPDELAHSQCLMKLIKEKINIAGSISFADYMQLALYAPGLGYYSAGKIKFGISGDFVTAPEISPLFSQCIARQCQQILTSLNGGDILEFGAGSGIMAAEVLLSLEQMHCLPTHYYILEVSPDLTKQQQTCLTEHCPHLFDRIQWLSQLPKYPFKGIVLANEVIDAMPVHRFYINEKSIGEMHVSWQQEKFIWRHATINNAHLKQNISMIHDRYLFDLPSYESEYNLYLSSWLKNISDCLAQGLVLLIDYGFPRHEYYHPDRYMGTLMCHYRHFTHSDPLILVGLQDITAHVDFTAVATHAAEINLNVAGYATQAGFLFGCGITELMSLTSEHTYQQMTIAQQIKTLTQPHEMGELFKVIALTRGIDTPLVGFSLQDLRAHL